ncbi:MAG: histidine kinase, partial [Bacteroidota bacterium]
IGPDRCLPLLTKSSEASQEIYHLTRMSFRESADKREEFKESVEREKRYRSRTGYLSVVGFLIALFYYLYQRSLREKLENKLEALRAQMNPHFISNCLNAIDLLVNKGDTEQASNYIIDFSRLNRLVLTNSKKKRISLAKEVETLSYYLRMEKLRMRENLNYHIEIDSTLDQESISIAPMLLQPFIENSIVHGIQNKQSPGNIWVLINRLNAKQLEIRIKDDGVGMKRAKEIKSKKFLEQERTSWGMDITHERLKGIKSEKGASIRTVDLYDKDGAASGTEVIIHYPIIYLKTNVNE